MLGFLQGLELTILFAKIWVESLSTQVEKYHHSGHSILESLRGHPPTYSVR